jgi:hypothetical protein
MPAEYGLAWTSETGSRCLLKTLRAFWRDYPAVEFELVIIALKCARRHLRLRGKATKYGTLRQLLRRGASSPATNYLARVA